MSNVGDKLGARRWRGCAARRARNISAKGDELVPLVGGFLLILKEVQAIGKAFLSESDKLVAGTRPAG